jgi:hypothetical protein
MLTCARGASNIQELIDQLNVSSSHFESSYKLRRTDETSPLLTCSNPERAHWTVFVSSFTLSEYFLDQLSRRLSCCVAGSFQFFGLRRNNSTLHPFTSSPTPYGPLHCIPLPSRTTDSTSNLKRDRSSEKDDVRFSNILHLGYHMSVVRQPTGKVSSQENKRTKF